MGDPGPSGRVLPHVANIRRVIQHVTLAVPPARAEACGRFWALLGFEPVEPPESLRERAAWWQKGVQQVHLLRAEDGGPRRGGSPVAPQGEDWGDTPARGPAARVEPEERAPALGAAPG